MRAVPVELGGRQRADVPGFDGITIKITSKKANTRFIALRQLVLIILFPLSFLRIVILLSSCAASLGSAA